MKPTPATATAAATTTIISTTIVIGRKFQGRTGCCYHRCELLEGANRAAHQIGKLGIYSCRCKNCNYYYPLKADYITMQPSTKARRCPCCNKKLAWRPKSKVRRERIEELEKLNLIRRI